ncbi:MAG: ABC transporter permease [Planctomycetota bacterium]|nr:ABC transporter permease [Planctomycetota bacterium]
MVTRNLMTSMRPFWLLGVGALAALLILALIWLIAYLVHRRTAIVISEIVREKVVFPVLMLAMAFGLFTLVMTAIDYGGGRFFDLKVAALKSLLRIPQVGQRQWTVDVPAGTADQEIVVKIPAGELNSIQLEADQLLTISWNRPVSQAESDEDLAELRSDEPFGWVRGPEPSGPLAGQLQSIFVTNETKSPARVSIDIDQQIVVPEARIIVYTALGLVLFVMFYVALQLFFPKIAAVALTTGKEAVNQPLYYLTMTAGCFLLLLFIFTPYFTFGEDVKVYKDAGLQLIMILAIIVALWTASVSVAEEIEGRTALTVLSKPISRQQFVLGKYLGIVSPVALMFILLGTLFLICISYKVMYDARESSNAYVVWQDCHLEVIRMVPGLVLAFMETVVLAAISVAISTRLSMLANLTICTAIYVVGHLLPLLVQSGVGEFAIVQFMGQLFATILPVLEHFNIYGAVAAGKDVPLSYLGWVGVYTLVYVTIAMLLALALFDDRDLA